MFRDSSVATMRTASSKKVASTKSALVAAFKELKAGSRGRKTLSFSFNNEPLGGDIDALMNALPLVDGISFDVILEILGISSVACASSVDDANTFANILNSLLKRKKENEVQAELLKFLRNSGENALIDCSSSSRNAPFLMLSDSTKDCCTFSSRPDLASLALPLFLELKDSPSEVRSGMKYVELSSKEYEVIQQVIRRIQSQKKLNDLLKRIICFATCGCRAWMVVFSRSIQRDSQRDGPFLHDHINVCRISIEDIYPLILSLNQQAIQDPFIYVHPDMGTLAYAMRQLQIHPGYALVKMIKYEENGTRIFEIQPYVFSGSKHAVQIPMEKESIKRDQTNPKKNFCKKLVVKINQKNHGSHSRREITAISRVYSRLNSLVSASPVSLPLNPVDYVVGFVKDQVMHVCNHSYLKTRFKKCFPGKNWKFYGKSINLFYPEPSPPSRRSPRFRGHDELLDSFACGKEDKEEGEEGEIQKDASIHHIDDDEFPLEEGDSDNDEHYGFEDHGDDNDVEQPQGKEGISDAEEEGEGMLPAADDIISNYNRFVVDFRYSNWKTFSLRNHLACWFAYDSIMAESKDCLIMKHGRSLSCTEERVEAKRILRAHLTVLFDSFHIAHTDIRPENLLIFDGEHRLIDYDHSVTFDQSNQCFLVSSDFSHPGARYNNIQEVLLSKLQTIPETVLWTLECEIEMLFLALSPPSTSSTREISISLANSSSVQVQMGSLVIDTNKVGVSLSISGLFYANLGFSLVIGCSSFSSIDCGTCC